MCLTHLTGRIHGGQQLDWGVFFMLDSLLFPMLFCFWFQVSIIPYFLKKLQILHSLFSIITRVMKNHVCTQFNFHWNKEELAVLGKTLDIIHFLKELFLF